MLLQLRPAGLALTRRTAAAAMAGAARWAPALGAGSVPPPRPQRGLSSLAAAPLLRHRQPPSQRIRLWGLLQQRRSMFIQTEATPNPESLKYLPGQTVLEEKYGTGMVRSVGRLEHGWMDGWMQRCTLDIQSAHRPTTPPHPHSKQYFRQGDKEVNRSPLAKKLLRIPGVVGVFLGRNFITITKTPDIIWQVSPWALCLTRLTTD